MTDYILEPLDTDTESIFQDFVDFIQGYYPEWDPSEGQLDVLIARFFAMQIAYTADMASRVQRAIFRYFGSSLAGILPLDGSAATATVVFTFSAGRTQQNTLSQGALVGLTDRDGDSQIFALLDDLVVEAATATASAIVQAIELGESGNNLTGTVEMVEMVDWIDSIEVDGYSAGGSNPEEDDVYIERLTQNLALMAPRPIIAYDFAMLAQNISGVWRAAAIDNFNPGTTEKQTITSNRTTGAFTLSFAGAGPTATIPFNGTIAQVKSALVALSTLDDVDFTVTGGPLGTAPIVIEFGGQYIYQDVPMITADTSGLSGGTSFTITQTQAAVTWTLTGENMIAISALDEAGNGVSGDVKAYLLAYLESLRAQNFTIRYIEPSRNRVDVNYTGVSLPTADADTVKSNVEANLAEAFNPATWGQLSVAQGNRDWVLTSQGKLRYLDVTTIVENTLGYDYTTNLDFALAGSAMDKTDKTFKGPFPLAYLGTITGTVTQG